MAVTYRYKAVVILPNDQQADNDYVINADRVYLSPQTIPVTLEGVMVGVARCMREDGAVVAQMDVYTRLTDEAGSSPYRAVPAGVIVGLQDGLLDYFQVNALVITVHARDTKQPPLEADDKERNTL